MSVNRKVTVPVGMSLATCSFILLPNPVARRPALASSRSIIAGKSGDGNPFCPSCEVVPFLNNLAANFFCKELQLRLGVSYEGVTFNGAVGRGPRGRPCLVAPARLRSLLVKLRGTPPGCQSVRGSSFSARVRRRATHRERSGSSPC